MPVHGAEEISQRIRVGLESVAPLANARGSEVTASRKAHPRGQGEQDRPSYDHFFDEVPKPPQQPRRADGLATGALWSRVCGCTSVEGVFLPQPDRRSTAMKHRKALFLLCRAGGPSPRACRLIILHNHAAERGNAAGIRIQRLFPGYLPELPQGFSTTPCTPTRVS